MENLVLLELIRQAIKNDLTGIDDGLSQGEILVRINERYNLSKENLAVNRVLRGSPAGTGGLVSQEKVELIVVNDPNVQARNHYWVTDKGYNSISDAMLDNLTIQVRKEYELQEKRKQQRENDRRKSMDDRSEDTEEE